MTLRLHSSQELVGERSTAELDIATIPPNDQPVGVGFDDRTPLPVERLDYLIDMIDEMRTMAGKAGLQRLCWMLTLAQQQASVDRTSPRPTPVNHEA